MSKKNESDRQDGGAVLDFTNFKKKKEVEEEVARGRDPLFVSHLKGKVTGSPHLKGPSAQDFGDRLTRIRTSLEKINSLMVELKKMSSEERVESIRGKKKADRK